MLPRNNCRKIKNDSTKKPRVGKTSTSDKELKVQRCEGIITFQSIEKKQELILYHKYVSLNTNKKCKMGLYSIIP